MSPMMLRFLSYWPPFLGAGIRVKEINSDYTALTVEMKLRFWNRNYVGTQFGGSLYAMVDPFLMLMLMQNLGSKYLVWDKAATIRFRKPGRGLVRAKFELSREKIAEIRERADADPKYEPVFTVLVLTENGEIIAEVEKTLYVKRKDKIRSNHAAASS